MFDELFYKLSFHPIHLFIQKVSAEVMYYNINFSSYCIVIFSRSFCCCFVLQYCIVIFSRSFRCGYLITIVTSVLRFNGRSFQSVSKNVNTLEALLSVGETGVAGLLGATSHCQANKLYRATQNLRRYTGTSYSALLNKFLITQQKVRLVVF